MKRRVLVMFPTAWDGRQLDALPPEVRACYEVVFDEPRDEDVRWNLDVLAHVDDRARRWRDRIDGVFSSSDYPGAAAAAAVARALDLPGPPPASVVRAGHKYLSRLAQRGLAPGAVPRFALIDPADEGTWPPAGAFPCFVKPVKGSFSLFARRVADRRDLRELLASSAVAEHGAFYVHIHEELVQRYGPCEHGARGFLAEELMTGQQVTVEGWVQDGEAHVLGVVDTSFHPGTTSFARFDYPSALPPAVQDELGALAGRVALGLGLDHTLFNVEMFHDDATGRTGIIEVNPRLCGQFGDLYQKVDGTSGFEVALALACGERPAVRRRGGRFAAAASLPLRVFESCAVKRVPDAGEVRAAEARHPGSLIWVECRAGEVLRVSPDAEDGQSVRYGVLNLGAPDRAELVAKRDALLAELGLELVPLGSGVR